MEEGVKRRNIKYLRMTSGALPKPGQFMVGKSGFKAGFPLGSGRRVKLWVNEVGGASKTLFSAQNHAPAEVAYPIFWPDLLGAFG
jgi:hypothetical protein